MTAKQKRGTITDSCPNQEAEVQEGCDSCGSTDCATEGDAGCDTCE
ncbi:MAG: hypothetical protein ACYDEQ_01450 [Desulfocucumaceae bacterium]